MTTFNDLNDDTPLVCRGCLIERKNMKNMLEHNLLDDFYIFSGVMADRAHSLTELLCASCERMLLECRRFRALCQQSDLILKRDVKDDIVLKSINGKNESSDINENGYVYTMYEKKLIIMITAHDMRSKIMLSCPYECPEVYAKKSELRNHMIRKHLVDKDYLVELQYHCSVSNCPYNIDSTKKKHFTGRKYLNQHYNKVHSNGRVTCDVCKINFSTENDYNRHLRTCNIMYECSNCNRSYKTNEGLLVHLMRNHPLLHQQYKNERRAEKRKSSVMIEPKRSKQETVYTCESPRRSFATQTLKLVESIRNDVTLPSWPEKNDYGTKTDEISTQTVFEDLLCLKSQAGEDDSIYFSETVSLSDIQTQTFPVEFGLSRCNKETVTSETQSPDLSMKETQTCFCLYDSPRYSCRHSAASSPVIYSTSTETQTADLGSIDAIFGCNTAETQTSFDGDADEDL